MTSLTGKLENREHVSCSALSFLLLLGSGMSATWKSASLRASPHAWGLRAGICLIGGQLAGPLALLLSYILLFNLDQ